MDDLHFEYPQDLQDRLALAEPTTDLSIRMYRKNANMWDQMFETDKYELLVERFKTLHNIPDERLTQEYVLDEWIPRLAEGFPDEEEIAKRTAEYNGRKPKGIVRDQLSLIIARIVPLFLLETQCIVTRKQIFGLRTVKGENGSKKQEPYLMIDLPNNKTYINRA